MIELFNNLKIFSSGAGFLILYLLYVYCFCAISLQMINVPAFNNNFQKIHVLFVGFIDLYWRSHQ